MSRAVVSAAARNAAETYSRTLFLRVTPPPASLAERRAVLRMLQRHGNVEVFKRLGDGLSYISIMSTIAAATDLNKRSPICYDLAMEEESEGPVFPGEEQPGITQPVKPVESTSPPGATAGAGSGISSDKAATRQHRSFTLHAFLSPDYQHLTKIRQSPLHGPWPSEPQVRQNFAFFALRDVVPKGPDHDALCDWATGSQLSDEGLLLRRQHQRDVEGRDLTEVVSINEGRRGRAQRRREAGQVPVPGTTAPEPIDMDESPEE